MLSNDQLEKELFTLDGKGREYKRALFNQALAEALTRVQKEERETAQAEIKRLTDLTRSQALEYFNLGELHKKDFMGYRAQIESLVKKNCEMHGPVYKQEIALARLNKAGTTIPDCPLCGGQRESAGVPGYYYCVSCERSMSR